MPKLPERISAQIKRLRSAQIRKDVQYDPTDVYNAEDDVVQEWVECVNLDAPALDEGQPPEPAQFVCDEIGSPAVREWRAEEAKRRKTTTTPFSVRTSTATDVIGDSPKRKSKAKATTSQKGKTIADPVRQVDEEIVGSDDETEEDSPKDIGYKTHDDDDDSSKSTSSSGFAADVRARMGSALDPIPPDYDDRGRRVSDDRSFGSQSERKTYSRRKKGPGGSQAAAGAEFATGIFGDSCPYYMDPPRYRDAEPPRYPYQDPQNYSYGYGYAGASTAELGPLQGNDYSSSQTYHSGVDSLSETMSQVHFGSDHTQEDVDRSSEVQQKAVLMGQWTDYYSNQMSWDEYQTYCWNVHQVWLDSQPFDPPRSSMWY